MRWFILLGTQKKFKVSSRSSKDMLGKSVGVSLPVESDSSTSNTDWKNWVVVHGNKKKVKADVCEVGKIIGV